MNILAFDTATNACSVALKIGDRIFSRHVIAPQQQAKLILPMIQDLLCEAKVEVTDLNAIALGCGPGSFMGVRLAMATAQGLAFAAHIPLILISTLQILAQTAFEQTNAKKILAGWDARMDEIYWGYYVVNEQGMTQEKISDQLCAPEHIDMALISDVGFTVAGNAWAVYEKKIPAQLLSRTTEKQTTIYPEALSMLTIAVSKYLQNEIVSPINAEPHYVRHHVVHTTSK